MFRITPETRIEKFRRIWKKFSFINKNARLNPHQLFQQRHKIYHQSNIFPAIFGISALTFASAGITYHLNENVRDYVKPYISKKTQIKLDEYLGPDCIDNIKKRLPELPSLEFSLPSFFPGQEKEFKSKTSRKFEAKPLDTEIEDVIGTNLSVNEPPKTKEEKEADRILKMNENFSNKISNHMTQLDTLATNAVLHLMEYQTKIEHHNNKLKRAIEDDGTTTPNPWEDVSASNHLQQIAKAQSDSEMKKLEMSMKLLEIMIKDGQRSEELKSNPLLRSSQQATADIRYRVKQKEADIEKAQFTAQIINQYKELIQQGRERFKQELSSLSPNASTWSNTRSDKLTTDDLNTMIIHAHRRMHQLQARIAELEAMEVLRLETALVAQKKSDEKEADEKVERELERERSKLVMEKLSEIEALEAKHEMDLRRALTRQALAHNEHVNQLLRIQKDEVDKQHNLLVREALLRERERMRAAIEGWRMRVEGLEAAVEGRADEEIVSREAQDMWVACHALHGVLTGNGITPPLARYLSTFEEAAQPTSLPVLKIFLDSIPRCAIDEGVHTYQSLAKRFDKLKMTCKRVAMIDESGASLPMYIVSWLRSIFMLTPSHLIEPDTEIDPINEVLETDLIIASAELAVCRNDIDLAVRLLNLLKGMPRAVAHDWLSDARIYLETKLAAEALSSYTSAKTAGSIPPIETTPLE